MPTPAGATCPRHASTLAVDVCERCGRFVCGECTVIRAQQTLCVECSAVPWKASARSTLALVLGLLGFVTCGPVSAAALAVGLVELRAIERHEAPAQGLSRARWAVRLGAVQLVLLALLVGVFVAWRLLR